MYNGLTTADKGALLDAQSIGEEWVVFYRSGSKEFYTNFPIVKNAVYTMSVTEALAQIAEMESEEKPMTNGEKILEQYANSVHRFASSRVQGITSNGQTRYYRAGINKGYKSLAEALSDEEAFLNSPYTEGETK